MDAGALGREFAGELRQIAEWTEFLQISRVEMVLGSSYNIAAKELEEQFEDLLESEFSDSKLDGAVVSVKIVHPGDKFSAPNRSDTQIASGYEILITNMQGCK